MATTTTLPWRVAGGTRPLFASEGTGQQLAKEPFHRHVFHDRDGQVDLPTENERFFQTFSANVHRPAPSGLGLMKISSVSATQDTPRGPHV